MAKRFTDTEKWRDEWWGSLDNDYRMIWLYLVDSCSIAGIWKKDFRGLNFNCNTKIDEHGFKEVFEGRVIDCGNFYFIPKFLSFQYPKGLNSNKPAILSVIEQLRLNNLIDLVCQSLGNDFLIIKDKDKDKDKDKNKVKDKDKDKKVVMTLDLNGGTIDDLEPKVIYPFDSEEFKNQWEVWKDYKKKDHKFKYKSIQSEQGALKELSNLSRGNEVLAIQIIEQSICNGWKGFFELKNKTNGQQHAGITAQGTLNRLNSYS